MPIKSIKHTTMTDSPLLTHGMNVVFSVPGAPVWPAMLDRQTDPKALFAKFVNEDRPWHIDCCWGYYCKQNNLSPKDHDMLNSILSVNQGISLKTLIETPRTLEAALKAMTRPNPFDNVVCLPDEIKVLVDGARKATLEPFKERKSLVLRYRETPGLPLWITPSEVNPEEDSSQRARLSGKHDLLQTLSGEEDYENPWFTRLTVDRPGNPTLREVLCLWSKDEIRALNSNAVQGTHATVATVATVGTVAAAVPTAANTIVVRVKPEAYDEILNGLRAKETKLTQEIATLTTIRDLQASTKVLAAQRNTLVNECGL
jgi:hypothetical protein